MTLEKVIQEVQNMAEEQRKTLIREAEKTARTLESEARTKAEKIKKENHEKIQTAVNELRNMQLSSYRLELNKQALLAKKEIMDNVFDLALEKTGKLKTEEKRKIFKKLLEQALRELPSAVYYYANKEDSKILQELNPKLKPAKIINCVSGFILENNEQTVKVNYTFEVLFKKIREDCLHEVARKIIQN